MSQRGIHTVRSTHRDSLSRDFAIFALLIEHFKAASLMEGLKIASLHMRGLLYQLHTKIFRLERRRIFRLRPAPKNLWRIELLADELRVRSPRELHRSFDRRIWWKSCHSMSSLLRCWHLIDQIDM